MKVRFIALETVLVEALRGGASDANGQHPERQVSPGRAPCRHCLEDIAEGEPMLVAALRPFPRPQPYAEVGPIFLHADACPRGGGDDRIPPFLDSPEYIVRGYGRDDRIAYGTGRIVATPDIPRIAGELLDDARIAYVHVRSATNNCYHCRIERA